MPPKGVKYGAYRKKSLSCKFWERVDKDGPAHPIYGKCWVWIGKIDAYGYGKLTSGSPRTRYIEVFAHRFSFELEFGLGSAETECVLHRCDIRRCVNPSHLFLGSRQDNTQDMVDKDRQLAGEACPSSKLTEGQVREIRRRYVKGSSGRDGARSLGVEFGVHSCTIQLIAKRKLWKHI